MPHKSAFFFFYVAVALHIDAEGKAALFFTPPLPHLSFLIQSFLSFSALHFDAFFFSFYCFSFSIIRSFFGVCFFFFFYGSLNHTHTHKKLPHLLLPHALCAATHDVFEVRVNELLFSSLVFLSFRVFPFFLLLFPGRGASLTLASFKEE